MSEFNTMNPYERPRDPWIVKCIKADEEVAVEEFYYFCEVQEFVYRNLPNYDKIEVYYDCDESTPTHEYFREDL